VLVDKARFRCIDGSIGRGENAGEMELDVGCDGRRPSTDTDDRLEQVCVRPGEDVDARCRPAEEPASSAAPAKHLTQLGMEIARVHDPERAVGGRGSGSEKSARSHPFGMEIAFHASSGIDAIIRLAASGVFMTTASAAPRTFLIRSSSSRRCRPVG
jgi:hypothetical protein